MAYSHAFHGWDEAGVDPAIFAGSGRGIVWALHDIMVHWIVAEYDCVPDCGESRAGGES